MVLHIDAPFPVRAHVGPAGIFVLVLLGVVGELAGSDIIIETVFHEFAGGVAGAVPLLLLGLDVPLEGFVILQFQPQGKVAGIVGVTGDFRNLAGQTVHVEDFLLAAGGGIHNVVAGAVGRFPAVPEPVGFLEPVGPDAGGIHHLADFLGGKAGGLLIVGLGDLLRLLRFLGPCGEADTEGGQKNANNLFHG